VKRDKTLFHIRDQDVFFAQESLYLMTNKSKIRYNIAKLVTSKYFDGFIISLITIYFVLLGLSRDDTDIDSGNAK
jgi:hypothetical protein